MAHTFHMSPTRFSCGPHDPNNGPRSTRGTADHHVDVRVVKHVTHVRIRYSEPNRELAKLAAMAELVELAEMDEFAEMVEIAE